MSRLPINFHEVLERLDGDRELLLEIYGIFLEKAPGMIADLRAEATTGCVSGQAQQLIHDVKGLAANIGADDLKLLAQQYEAAVQQQKGLGETLPLCELVLNEFVRVCDAVRAYCRDHE